MTDGPTTETWESRPAWATQKSMAKKPDQKHRKTSLREDQSGKSYLTPLIHQI